MFSSKIKHLSIAASLAVSLTLAGASPARAAQLSEERTCHFPQLDTARLVAEVQPYAQRPPTPMPHLHTEGTLPGHGIHDASVNAAADFPVLQKMALAYSFTKDPFLLRQSRIYLNGWSATYQPDLNPIDETHFSEFFLAYGMLRDNVPAAERSRIDSFVRSFANGYLREMKAHSQSMIGTWFNNWQSHRIKLVTLAAVTLRDEAMLNDAQEFFYLQIARNVQEDGSVEDFHERDALHYVTYDLQPLVEAALAARQTGRDWLHQPSATGSTLERAIDWLTPYARGSKTHVDFVNSKVPFDRVRRDAGVKGEQIARWQASNGLDLFWLAAQLDRKYLPVATLLRSSMPESDARCL